MHKWIHKHRSPACFVPVQLSEWEDITLQNYEGEASPYYRIVVVVSGKGILQGEEKEHLISRRDMVRCPPGQRLSIVGSTRAPLHVIQLEYDALGEQNKLPQAIREQAWITPCSIETMRVVLELRQAWLHPRAGEPYRIQQLFTELLIAVEKERAMDEQNALPWLEDALAFMEAHYHHEVTREQLASRANVSPEHFSRMFRKHTGRTYTAHLTLLRVRHAQRRLLTQSMVLHALAQEVGYKESTYLSRKFKELVKLSPTRYQHKPKRIVALNVNHTASLLALGVVPELGVYTTWLREQLSGSCHAGCRLEDSLAQSEAYYRSIAAAEPDVIIHYEGAEGNRQLLPVAPVLEIPVVTMGWREQFEFLGAIVNRPEQARHWLEQFTHQIEACNQQLNQRLGCRGTAIVWEICDHAAYGIGSCYGRGAQILYEELGFRMPQKAMEQSMLTEGYIEVPIEQITDYPADYLFITSLPTEREALRRVEQLFLSEQWQSMEAVRQDHVHILDHGELFYGYDPLSSAAQLKRFMEVLCPDHNII